MKQLEFNNEEGRSPSQHQKLMGNQQQMITQSSIQKLSHGQLDDEDMINEDEALRILCDLEMHFNKKRPSIIKNLQIQDLSKVLPLHSKPIYY